jgi:hypothetical protein
MDARNVQHATSDSGAADNIIRLVPSTAPKKTTLAPGVRYLVIRRGDGAVLAYPMADQSPRRRGGAR